MNRGCAALLHAHALGQLSQLLRRPVETTSFPIYIPIFKVLELGGGEVKMVGSTFPKSLGVPA